MMLIGISEGTKIWISAPEKRSQSYTNKSRELRDNINYVN